MPITKFDLYKDEWLDLVFDHRNKSYGAYELRQHYGSNMAKAMAYTFTGVAFLIASSIVFKPKPAPEYIFHPVDISKTIIQPVLAHKKTEKVKPVKPAAAPDQARALAPIKTTKLVNMVVVQNPTTEEPPKNADIKGAVGPQNIDAPANGNNIIPTDNTKTSGGGGTGTGVDNGIYQVGGLDVMPEPIGGDAAWARFLQKNMRYPPLAQEQGISGRVILSFVVEKDGRLSNITVVRPAGSGFDEEAVRVLKLAKAWKPGIQNGQPVRVAYTIPISFQTGEQ